MTDLCDNWFGAREWDARDISCGIWCLCVIALICDYLNKYDMLAKKSGGKKVTHQIVDYQYSLVRFVLNSVRNSLSSFDFAKLELAVLSPRFNVVIQRMWSLRFVISPATSVGYYPFFDRWGLIFPGKCIWLEHLYRTKQQDFFVLKFMSSTPLN